MSVGRLTRSGIHDDPGEKNLARIEEAVGSRPKGCPWRSLSDPLVIEVIRAHAWWMKGELSSKYPRGVPQEIVDGIDVYNGALNATHHTDSRLDREERERRQQQQRAQNPQPPTARMRKR